MVAAPSVHAGPTLYGQPGPKLGSYFHLVEPTVLICIRADMKNDLDPVRLVQQWSLSSNELQMLVNKTGATRLNFAILLKTFQLDGRFPERREDVADRVVEFVANQVGVPKEVYREGELSERTQRLQRAQVRAHYGFHSFRADDETRLIEWLTKRVDTPNADGEPLKMAAYGYLRSRRLEPPGSDRLHRLLSTAIELRKQQGEREKPGAAV